MNRRTRRRGVAVLVAMTLAASTRSIHAIDWAANVSGNFNDGTKWTGGVAPSAGGHSADFSVSPSGAYTVTFTNSPSIGGMFVRTNNNVNFITDGTARSCTTTQLDVQNAGGVLTLAGSGAALQINTLQVAVNLTGALNINAGNDVSTGLCNVGNSGNGTVSVSGSGSTLVSSGTTNIVNAINATGTLTFSNSAGGSFNTLNVGNFSNSNSSATLTVQSDADVTGSGIIRVGTGGAVGQTATLTVTGAGSTFVQSGPQGITIGAAANSTGTLSVASGGAFTTGTSTTTVNATGLIDISSGTFNANGNLTVQNGGTVQRGLGGTFNLAAAKTMTVQGGGDFNVTGDYAMSTTGVISITGAGSTMQVGSDTLSIGGGGQISLDSGGSLTAYREEIGDASGSGSVVQSDGTHTISGGINPLRIAGTVGSTGNYMLSGGTLNVVNNFAGANAEAVGFNGTATFTQTGGDHIVSGTNGNMVIGYAATGVGMYTISNGNLTAKSLYLGRDSGGQGTLTINSGGNVQIVDEFLDLGLNAVATGTVNANAGTLSAKGIFVGGISSASGGTGVMNIAGGSVTSSVQTGLTNSGQVRVWNTASSAINFSSGSLSCDKLLTSGNPALFNWTGGTLTLGTGDGSSTFDAAGSGSGSLVKSGTGTVSVTGNNTYSGPTIINAGSIQIGIGGTTGTIGSGNVTNNGVLSFVRSNALSVPNNIAGSGALAQTGSGTTTLSGVLSYTGGTIASVGRLVLNTNLTTSSQVTANGTGTIELAGNGTSMRVIKTPIVSVAGGGKIDLRDNKLITATAIGTITGLIASGRNGGIWNGTGITTSMTDATSGGGYTMIGVASGQEARGLGAPTDTDVWGGQTVTGSDTLVMYTYGGDANLSGFVDVDDYGLIDFNAALGGVLTGWFNGDFDYNGFQDVDDYGIIDFVVGIQGAPFPTAGTGVSIAAVPEPVSIGLLGLGAMAVLARRRRIR